MPEQRTQNIGYENNAIQKKCRAVETTFLNDRPGDLAGAIPGLAKGGVSLKLASW